MSVFAPERPAASAGPKAQFEYLEKLVNELERIDDPRCRRIRGQIIHVVSDIERAFKAIEADPELAHERIEDGAGSGRPSFARRVAERAMRTLKTLEPDVLEANYFLAHRFLSRHRHRFPAGEPDAIAEPVYDAIQVFAKASRAYGQALRDPKRRGVEQTQRRYRQASLDVASQLEAHPVTPLEP
ncbi:MAG: hypothetical protein AAFP04_10265 [Myxococcota bacterium]